MIRREQPQRKIRERRWVKIPLSEHAKIVERVKTETLTSVGKDYGVTRERIRQIATEGGVVRREIVKEQKDALCLQYAEEVLYYREAWLSVHWKDLPIHGMEFVRWLSQHGADHPEIEDRWIVARHNYASHGMVCLEGRVCIHCGIWMEWDYFYASKGEANDHTRGCKECTKAIVMHYYHLKDVPEPTVTERRCPKCGETKPASEFFKSTHLTDGLQTYCKSCHMSFPSQQPGY